MQGSAFIKTGKELDLLPDLKYLLVRPTILAILLFLAALQNVSSQSIIIRYETPLLEVF
jgi:hypothetical protein